jgi:hypothetical protein
LKQLVVLKEDKEIALQKWKDYVEAEKKTSDKTITDLKRVYRAVSKGHRILDLYETLKRVPLNSDGDPAMAIVRTDKKKVWFTKHERGAGTYQGREPSWRNNTDPERVHLPQGTFPAWKTGPAQWNPNTQEVTRKVVSAPTPAIQSKLAHLLSPRTYVLWEVEKWEPVAPKDPVLLQRVTNNLFVILGQWNLTKLERAVIQGRI